MQKGGVDVREFALATFAMLHAGTYLMSEQMNKAKAKAKATFSSYTREQQASIELLRSSQTK